MADQELDLSGFDAAVGDLPKELDLSSFDAAQKTPEEISSLESLGRGAAQGATFGFGDELAGAGSSAVQTLLESLNLRPEDNLSFTEKYAKERDITRANNKAAEEANPWTYGGGNVLGAIGTGLLAGGAGIGGKVLGALGTEGTAAGLADAATGATVKQLIAAGASQAEINAAKKAALLGLTKIGAAEGALMGYGTSEGKDLKEQAEDTLTGAAMGAAAPTVLKAGGKLLKAGGFIADKTTDLVPGVKAGKKYIGNILGKTSDVYTLGTENAATGPAFKAIPGKTIEEKAIEHAKDLSKPVREIQSAGLDFENKFIQDLNKAQTGSASNLDEAQQILKKDLADAMDIHGAAMSAKDEQIQKIVDSNPGWQLRSTPDGLQFGKFNFDPLDKVFEEVQGSLDQPKPILNKIQKEIKNADYLTVTKKIRDISRLMSGNISPNDFHYLQILKDGLQEVVDKELTRLPGEGAEIYAARMADAKKYSQLANFRNKLSAEKWQDTGDLADAAKFMANTTETGGKPLLRSLETAREVATPEFNQSADQLIATAEDFNKYKINPTKGKLGLGLNEDASKAYSSLYGAAKGEESGVSTGLAKQVEDIASPAKTISGNIKQEDTESWIRKYMFGPGKEKEADAYIENLKKLSSKHDLTKLQLDPTHDYGSTTHGFWRALKKASDPIAYGIGQDVQRYSDLASKAGFNKTTAARALTQSRTYKDIVEDFKQSQQNNGVESEK